MESTKRVAVLFAMRNSIYNDFPSAEVYDDELDAFNYEGPHRVICHPPCARWGKYATTRGNTIGDDDGAFGFCLNSLRYWGGVIEHPAYSKAWEHFGLPRPNPRGGWTEDGIGGFTCHVEQGHYGHPAPKATWLYIFGVRPIELKWGYSEAEGRITKMNRTMREHTPLLFAQLLVNMVMA